MLKYKQIETERKPTVESKKWTNDDDPRHLRKELVAGNSAAGDEEEGGEIEK